MSFKRLIWIVPFVLLLGGGLVLAQETTPSLRDLADQNNLYVGAAVYAGHLDDPAHQDVLSREFDMLTPENEAKFCAIQPEQGQFDFTNFDTLVDFAEAHDMAVHGHTLVWHSCVPPWVATANFSREEAIEVMRDHIMAVVGRYKGRVAIWDVVNEGVGEKMLRRTIWQQWIGDDYIDLAFQFAHEADPDALLFYNDYGAEGMNTKSDTIYALVKGMVERGIPIHGVGLQAHFFLGPLDTEAIAENMQRLGELGLQVQITEMDVKFPREPTEAILQQEAEEYAQMMDTCLNSEYCTAFIVWGVTDKYSWLRQPQFYKNPDVAPLLFDENYQPKPAYFALLDLLESHAGSEVAANRLNHRSARPG